MAPVPSPTRTAWAVRVDAPVPPCATLKPPSAWKVGSALEPLDVSTWPAVPGAAKATALVPSPSSTLWAVSAVMPVPPRLTSTGALKDTVTPPDDPPPFRPVPAVTLVIVPTAAANVGAQLRDRHALQRACANGQDGDQVGARRRSARGELLSGIEAAKAG